MMPMHTVPATLDLVPSLLARMEPSRVARMQERTCGQAAAVIEGNIARSTLTWCGLDAGGVVTMGGVESMEAPGTGYVWQFITSAVQRNKRAYLEQGRAMIAVGLRQYARLLTIIEADYAAALRHTRRNGWTVGHPQQFSGGLGCLCERMR